MIYDWIEDTAEDHADELRRDAIEYYIEEVILPDTPRIDREDAYESACDAIDMTSDHLMYPGNWAAYRGGCYLIDEDANEDPEESFWALVDNEEVPTFEKSTKWDQNVFYYYNKDKDETVIRAVVPC